MASRGYQAIEDPQSDTRRGEYEAVVPILSTAAAEEKANKHAQGDANTEDNSTNIVANIKQNAQNIISSEVPPINFYTDPLNPSTNMSLKDRISLVLESARPWSEFFDLRQFNVPPSSELKLRVVHNMETYFYNYFLVALVDMMIFAFGHIGSVLALGALLSLAFYLYVLNPEPIDVFGVYQITASIKHTIIAVLSVLALLYGHVLLLILSTSIFMTLFVGIHTLFRDHTI